MILSVARGLAGGTDTSPARPIKKIEMLKKRFKRATSRPVHSKPARFHDDIFILAGKFHQVHQQFHIVFAVGTDLFLAALAPPLDNLEAIAGLLVPQRFPGQVIEFNAESEPALQVREQVKRFADKIAHRMVPAKYLEIEAVPVKRNDALKLAQFGDERLDVRLKPAPEAVVRVPRHCHGEAKLRDVGPATFDFVGKPERFDVEKYFSGKVRKKAGVGCHI